MPVSLPPSLPQITPDQQAQVDALEKQIKQAPADWQKFIATQMPQGDGIDINSLISGAMATAAGQTTDQGSLASIEKAEQADAANVKNKLNFFKDIASEVSSATPSTDVDHKA